MADTSTAPDTSTPPGPSSEAPSTAPRTRRRSKTNNPAGVYTLPGAAHQALRYAALVISFENEGNEKEHTTADDVLTDAITRHLAHLQKEGIKFPDYVLQDLIKAKLIKA